MELFKLLLNINQLEYKVRDIIKYVSTEKESHWYAYRKEANERSLELSQMFSTTNSLMKIKKNDDLTQIG